MDETPPNTNGTPMETKSEPPNFRVRFLWLVAAHVVIGVLVGFLSEVNFRSEWLSVFPGCIVVGQISLLGIWGGLGGTVLWKRLIGVVCGICYLTVLMRFVIGQTNNVDTPIFIFCATASMMLMTLSIRFFTGAVCHESSSTGAAQRRQFSIRQLFVLTTVVAFLAAVLKWVFPLIDATYRQMFVGVFIYGVVYAVVALIPMWAVLATSRPVLYGVLGVAAETYVASVLGHMSDPSSNAAAILILTFVATQATYVVITLLIVRKWGYRLMPMRSRCPVVDTELS